MRVYRFLLIRLATKLTVIIGFLLLCFALFSSLPRLFFFHIIPSPYSNPWNLETYTWLDFWMDGRQDTRVLEMGRFVFYVFYTLRGEYGFSLSTGNPVLEDVQRHLLPTFLLSAVALIIGFFFALILKVWKTLVVRKDERYNGRKRWILAGTGVAIIIFSCWMLISFVMICCPIVFHNIIFWRSLQFPLRYQVNIFDSRFFAVPAFALGGVVFVGAKLAVQITPHSRIYSPEDISNPPYEVKDLIMKRGLQAGFLCAFLVSAIFFVEAASHYGGVGELFLRAANFWDYSVLNSLFFLTGLLIILVSTVVEIAYGLVRFGPYRFNKI